MKATAMPTAETTVQRAYQWNPPRQPQYAEPTYEPCIRCGGPGATETWGLCYDCRAELQHRERAIVARLAKAHPAWYPEFARKR